ncbi:Lrp/AsnC family transcriptional regulator [Candidatus Woesearchaeota archaeon]|nr:Lrp/AsnC family transcriptional regulator [Candidatus Woesearchaeota archaeon]
MNEKIQTKSGKDFEQSSKKKILQKDLALFKQLRLDSRASLTTISKKTKIPISTLYDRLKYHEGELIQKHTSILNFNLLGFKARVQLLLKTPIEKREELKNFLKAHDNINNVWKITGNYDFLVEGYFQNMTYAEEFVENIEKKFEVQYDAHYIVEDIIREGFLAV